MSKTHIITEEDGVAVTEVVKWSYNKNLTQVLPRGKYYIGDFSVCLAEIIFNGDEKTYYKNGLYKSDKSDYLLFASVYNEVMYDSKMIELECENIAICSESIMNKFNNTPSVACSVCMLVTFDDDVLCNFNHPVKITCGENVILEEKRCDAGQCDECDAYC